MALIRILIAHRERDRKRFDLEPTQVTAKLTYLQSFHSQIEQPLCLHDAYIIISFRNTVPIDGHSLE